MAVKRECDMIAYWETRRHKDLFLYLSSVNGPTVKLHLMNIKSSKSLRFEGNYSMHTRPIINFSSDFDSTEHM